jgi:hypothetical protein
MKQRPCSETTLTGKSRYHISTPLGFEPGSLMTGSKWVTLYECSEIAGSTQPSLCPTASSLSYCWDTAIVLSGGGSFYNCNTQAVGLFGGGLYSVSVFLVGSHLGSSIRVFADQSQDEKEWPKAVKLLDLYNNWIVQHSSNARIDCLFQEKDRAIKFSIYKYRVWPCKTNPSRKA